MWMLHNASLDKLLDRVNVLICIKCFLQRISYYF